MEMPTIEKTTVTMNPKWPAFRDELDAEVKRHMDAGDVKAWMRALRRRMELGRNGDPVLEVRVTPSFMDAIKLDAAEHLGGEAFGNGGNLTFRRVPITEVCLG